MLKKEYKKSFENVNGELDLPKGEFVIVIIAIIATIDIVVVIFTVAKEFNHPIQETHLKNGILIFTIST